MLSHSTPASVYDLHQLFGGGDGVQTYGVSTPLKNPESQQHNHAGLHQEEEKKKPKQTDQACLLGLV